MMTQVKVNHKRPGRKNKSKQAMTLSEFVKVNHKRIDKEIKGKQDDSVIDDNERKLWVRHNEALRRIARQCGVIALGK